MNKKILLFLLFFSHSLIHSFILQAQNVKITGLAKTYENREIGVWVYRDFISNTEKQLTYSTIDSVGNFLLEFKCKGIQYITLKIDKSIASMYVDSGATYEIIIMPPDSTTYQNPNLEHDVKISIKLKSRTEINALTIDYDKRFDDFLTMEYKSFVSRNPQSKIDSFKVLIHNFYSDVKNNYFDAYRMYSIATLEEKTMASRKRLFNQYINQKPILYDNQEYFNFFNTFYKQYLRNIYLVHGQVFKDQIEITNNYNGIIDILKKDEFLKNDSIRELVLIKGLFESYYDGTYKKESIIKFLAYVLDTSVIDENKQIIQNIFNSFSKLKPGAPAPYFELPDKMGLTHSLDELRSKKFVYIFFFDQQGTACLQQMKIITSLKKRYGTRIEFVGISVDTTKADLNQFCLKNPSYDWLFLYDTTGAKLKNTYEIRSLPAYFLIDMEGRFVQVPADAPDGDIERVFYDITKPKARKHKVGDKKN